MEVGIIIGIVMLLYCPIAFIVGMYTERYRWNILIQRGILPKPKD